MATKTEQVLTALGEKLRTVPKAGFERNTAEIERIPAGGLIVLRDGEPGAPEEALGGVGSVYYAHRAAIELYVEAGAAAERDAAFDALVAAVGTALETDPTLGGLAYGITYGHPAIDTEAVIGGPAIKAGIIEAVIEYEAATPLG